MARPRDKASKPASAGTLCCRVPAEGWQAACCGNCPPQNDGDDDEESRPLCFGASDAPDPHHLSRCYALAYSGQREGDQDHRWATQCVFMMLFDHPAAALEIIRLAFERAETERQRTLIGCGELESLLANHSREMIGAVEQLARESSAFREGLSNVWRRGMPDDVWARVLKASGRSEA
jgi:hypothetical protein